MLLAIECIGLLSILDKSVFLNYHQVFSQILESENSCGDESTDPKEVQASREYYLKEKVIALKATIDGLIMQGIISDSTGALFTYVTADYLKIKNRYLR